MTRRLLVKLAPGQRSTICAECGQPADRPLYKNVICEPCFDELAERIAVRHALRGYGQRAEPCLVDADIRSRFPVRYVMLKCTSCSSVWYGPRGEPCSGCGAALELIRRHQAEMLVYPQLPHPDDVRHDGAVKAWGERLARAVESELLTEQQALAAWRKVVGDERSAA